MKKPLAEGGKTLTLTTALLYIAAFLGSLMTFGTAAQAETQAEAQASTPGVVGRIISCKISRDKQNVEIGFSSTGDVTGTDSNIYIFGMQPYEEELGNRSNFIASSPTLSTASVNVPLNLGIPQGKFYSRFALAVFDETRFIKVDQPHYITNPELIAKNQTSFNDPLTKKGFVIEIDMLNNAFGLGVEHVTTNIAFSQIMETGIDYQCDGETYRFSESVVDAYDETISTLSNKGMMVTVILFSDWNPNTSDLMCPSTQKNSNAFYCMFNVETEARFDQTKAIASFLAQHCSGSNPNYGKMSNWIVGSEINNQQWSCMRAMDLTNYVGTYQKAFHVIYTAIKNTNANNRAYFSLDYSWMNEIDDKLRYGGKEIVDSSNSIANTQEQVGWGLAYHLYPCPMTEPESWDDPQSTRLFTNDFNSPVINFANLSVLTDYFVQDTLRVPGGNMRHIIPTEQGFTSYNPTRGSIPEIQVVAYVYSYYLVDNNPYIDAYTVSRQVDAPSETKDGLKFGLWERNMNQPNLTVTTKRKKIWQVFRNIDKENTTLEVTKFVRPVIGISKWSNVVLNFR